ncbi:trypsin-like serine peptidase [Streptomyces sp. NPDC050560]|uniref:trypsin-like serine peptidase n=1 Tax=Streptomyces sp. NPDC050560 TaxID=3365630 RepID=UPI0037A6EA97
MRTPLVGTFTALLLLGAAATPAAAVALPDGSAAPSGAPVRAVDFAGAVALSNCSGSVVRMPDSEPTDPALVLSNGHCVESGMPGPGEVVLDQPSSRTFDLLDADAGSVATLQADKLAYATMTDTDISLYELTTTYQDIEDDYGIAPLDLSDQHPAQGNAITVVSGYWKQTYSCSIDGFVPQLKEADWTWKDSVRYTPECDTIGGTSGSPVVDEASGQVVAVNNTGNDDGGRCTLNNPCEVDEDGNVTVHQGTNYAEETYIIPACVGTGNKIDLSAPDCTLPKPADG